MLLSPGRQIPTSSPSLQPTEQGTIAVVEIELALGGTHEQQEEVRGG
jgi:hypothetical protein